MCVCVCVCGCVCGCVEGEDRREEAQCVYKIPHILNPLSMSHTHHNVVHTHAHSSFARFPDGRIEHYFCAKDKLAQEQDKDAPKLYDTNPF